MEIAEPAQMILGRYRLERTLGAGGMGVVYLARDSKLHRPVAIKQLRADATSDSAAARIRSEARLLAQLNHPNIVQLYDVVERDGDIALVMEYVEGTTLKEWMRERAPTLREKLDLLMQVCRGLTEAHRLGIVHRDLKPDNILIATGGTSRSNQGITAKITDFGIAKSLQQDSTDITRADHVAGTVDAMSPEQLQGLSLCPRSDLFSLGTIAYQLLCGTRPFDKGDGGSLALAHKVIHDPHIPPQQARPELPGPLAALLDRLLAKDPQNRPESARQVYEALAFLHQHQADDSDSGELSATVTQLLRKPPSQRRRLYKRLGYAAGLGVLAVAGWFGWEYATRLEPQYIAVMPVEINGEVRGEENAKALTATMVRQALMNSVSQLKASALVSFTPKEGQDFDAQLQALRDKGVTDALFARLECARVRCEADLQRIDPSSHRIARNESFVFLASNKQEADYQITTSAASMFEDSYLKQARSKSLMADSDYSQYLDIISRTEGKDVKESDLKLLEQLSNKYPKNINLYRAYARASGYLFIATDEITYLNAGINFLARAKVSGIDEAAIIEQELWLLSYNLDGGGFEELLERAQALGLPAASISSKRARYLYTQGAYNSGLEYAEKSAKLNPSAENLYLVALNMTAKGNYPEAQKTLNELIKKFPNHWASHGALAVIYGETGKFDAAERSIENIPPRLRNWGIYSNLGSSYLLQKQPQKALEKYHEALRLAPKNLPTLGNIAETYLVLGNEKESKKHYKRLLELTSGKRDIEERMYHALALAYLGNVPNAISEIYKLLDDAPEDTYVKYAAAQIAILAEEHQSASYYVEQLVDQGMSADWFILPVFHLLCTQPEISEKIKKSAC